MIQFEVGKTYYTRSICDHDCVIKMTVQSRTAKTLTTSEGKRFGIKVWNDVETIMPWGRYSMAPQMGADREVRSND